MKQKMKGQVGYSPINGYHTAGYKRHSFLSIRFCPFKSILVRVAGHLIHFSEDTSNNPENSSNKSNLKQTLSARRDQDKKISDGSLGKTAQHVLK